MRVNSDGEEEEEEVFDGLDPSNQEATYKSDAYCGESTRRAHTRQRRPYTTYTTRLRGSLKSSVPGWGGRH
jgi:hypothetical protein